MNPSFSTWIASPPSHLTEEAVRLSRELDLPLRGDEPEEEEGGWYLVLSPHDGPPGYRLELHLAGRRPQGPVSVELAAGGVAHRLRYGGGRGQDLARAAGFAPGRVPSVLDATAGLGRDTFVLAALGATVLAVERSPVIRALLENGLQRAAAVPGLDEVLARIRLVGGDAAEVMAALPEGERPDTVYLDPMYPERRKGAAVKKEMRLFRFVVGDDPDADRLLPVARHCALRRVAVKRPRLAPLLAGVEPQGRIVGRSTRFDLYAPVAEVSG